MYEKISRKILGRNKKEKTIFFFFFGKFPYGFPFIPYKCNTLVVVIAILYFKF